jgi:hypothetical protein
VRIRLFSSASDAPRATPAHRCPGCASRCSSSLHASCPPPDANALDTAVATLLQKIPGLFGGVWEISYDFLVIWSMFLLLSTLLAQDRLRVFTVQIVLICVLSSSGSPRFTCSAPGGGWPQATPGVLAPAQAIVPVRWEPHRVSAARRDLGAVPQGLRGVGVAEAAYTATLTPLGVPQSAAASTALTYRLVTFYIPPLRGGPAMRWMRQNRYL